MRVADIVVLVALVCPRSESRTGAHRAELKASTPK
jgi:hypothetical protein